MTIPAHVTYLILGSSVVVTLILLFGLNRAFNRANWPTNERIATVRVAAAVLVGWLAVAIGLSWLGVYRGTADGIPTIQFGLLIPILLGVILLWRSAALARVLDAVPQSWIVGIQFYRVLGAIFLLLYAAGQMPGLFAWPAGLGDVAVGLLAPIVAFAYARNPSENRRVVAAWNVFGIGDLIVAVAMGFLTAPSPLQLLAFEAPNEQIIAFPMVLVPVYLVPLAILLHLMSLIKLQRAASKPALDEVAMASGMH